MLNFKQTVYLTTRHLSYPPKDMDVDLSLTLTFECNKTLYYKNC